MNPTVKIKDVKDTAWYSESVKNAIAKDLMTLTDKGQFNPSLAMSISEFQLALQKMGLKVEVSNIKSPMTRLNMLQELDKVLNLDIDTIATESKKTVKFKDIDKNFEYYNLIKILSK